MIKYLLIILSMLSVSAQLKFSLNGGISSHNINLRGLIIRKQDTETFFANVAEVRLMRPTFEAYPVLQQGSIYVNENNTGKVWADETQTAYIIKASQVSSELQIYQPNLISRGNASPNGHITATETTVDDLEFTLTTATITPSVVTPYTYPTSSNMASTTAQVAIVPVADAEKLATLQKNLINASTPQSSYLSNHNQFQAVSIGGDVEYHYGTVFANAGASIHQPITVPDDLLNLIKFYPERMFTGHIGVGLQFMEINQILAKAGLMSVSGDVTAAQPADANIDITLSYPVISTQNTSELLTFVELSFSHQPKHSNMGFNASVRQGFDSFQLSTLLNKMEISQTNASFSLTYQP